MKKISALILSMALCVGMLTGCGGNSGKPAASAPAASAPAASAPAASTPSAEPTSNWPNGTVTLLCGFGAGGSSDIETRSLATYLEKVTGGTFVVQNITGANGWMAWDQLLHSDPDGQTISMVNTPALFYDYLDPSQGHSETMDDFDFICNEVIDFGVLVCKKGTYANMDEFMAAAKADGGVTVADVGANSNKHIATIEMGLNNTDATLTPVHQSGWADNYAALLGGTVDAISAVYGDVASILAEDELTVLCVFNEERVDVLPDVPTCEEAGYGPVYEAPARGYMLPLGVDAATKEAIVAAFDAAINDPDHVAELESMGLIVNYKEGDEYVNFLKSQETTVEALKPQLGWE